MNATLRLASGAFVCLSLGCGSGTPTSPSSSGGVGLTEIIQRPGITFHYATGDSVQPDWQDQYNAWAMVALDVRPTRTVVYNKYRDRAHMGQVIGVSNTNGFAEPATFTLHTIWPIDNHEVVHLYTSTFGSAVALFNEGIAVAHQMDPAAGIFVARWSGTPVHDLARQFRSSGRLISLDSLAVTSTFRTFDPNVTYPESGSFLRYLLDTYGLDRTKQFFAASTSNDSRDQIGRLFAAAYGISLADAEQQWWAFLDRR